MHVSAAKILCDLLMAADENSDTAEPNRPERPQRPQLDPSHYSPITTPSPQPSPMNTIKVETSKLIPMDIMENVNPAPVCNEKSRSAPAFYETLQSAPVCNEPLQNEPIQLPNVENIPSPINIQLNDVITHIKDFQKQLNEMQQKMQDILEAVNIIRLKQDQEISIAATERCFARNDRLWQLQNEERTNLQFEYIYQKLLCNLKNERNSEIDKVRELITQKFDELQAKNNSNFQTTSIQDVSESVNPAIHESQTTQVIDDLSQRAFIDLNKIDEEVAGENSIKTEMASNDGCIPNEIIPNNCESEPVNEIIPTEEVNNVEDDVIDDLRCNSPDGSFYSNFSEDTDIPVEDGKPEKKYNIALFWTPEDKNWFIMMRQVRDWYKAVRVEKNCGRELMQIWTKLPHKINIGKLMKQLGRNKIKWNALSSTGKVLKKQSKEKSAKLLIRMVNKMIKIDNVDPKRIRNLKFPIQNVMECE